ncbi:MAG: hypothetical protein QXS51_04020 [Thermoproteota archaeon]|nr:hypothetical protein [Candidatus Brockarchaeota archaeon]MBO3840587.1 hypothetical protein [Candidatus Brockarchaeota archaeon]
MVSERRKLRIRSRKVVQAKSITIPGCNPGIRKNAKIKAGMSEKTAIAT